MNHTRAFAMELRTAAEVTPAMIVRAADHIDTLMDVIEAQRGPVTPAPSLDLAPLRRLRRTLHERAKIGGLGFSEAQAYEHIVEVLNQYFPDRL